MDKKELITGNINGAVGKTKLTLTKLVVLGVMAGAFIALGAAGSNVGMHRVSNTGVARLIAGSIFPVGLMMIVFLGGELFTGDCMMFMAVLDKKISTLKMLKVWIIVYITNLIGGILVAVLCYESGQFNYSDGLLGAFTIKVALGKVNLSFLGAFASGILCNIFVCGAVLMASAAKEISGKVWAIFFPIMAFVVSGYEHCVANMYYIPAGMLASGNSKYIDKAMEVYGYTREQINSINIKSFLVDSAIPVTLGNIVGGAVCIGAALYFVHIKNEK